jgi:hypothetical protein
METERMKDRWRGREKGKKTKRRERNGRKKEIHKGRGGRK